MKTDDWGFPVEEKKMDSDYFNFPVGDTKLRVMTQPVGVKQYFKDGKFTTVGEDYRGPEKVNTKGWAWCIIRETGELKIVKFPYSVIKKVQAFMVDGDWEFEGFPMPYDLTVKKSGEGLESRYEVVPSPKMTPVTEGEKDALEKKTPIEQIISKMKEKAGVSEKKGIEYPENDNDGDIPF